MECTSYLFFCYDFTVLTSDLQDQLTCIFSSSWANTQILLQEIYEYINVSPKSLTCFGCDLILICILTSLEKL